MYCDLNSDKMTDETDKSEIQHEMGVISDEILKDSNEIGILTEVQNPTTNS